MPDLVAPPTMVPLPDGRRLAVDDVGDSNGRPVVFLHGSPSCRLGRPPLDHEVGGQGVRLLAFDRPGVGRSDLDPSGSATSFAGDLTAALDHLDVEHFDLLAWSAGATWALAAAGHSVLGPRMGRLTIVAGLVPVEAFEDPVVHDACLPSRAALLDTAAELGPQATAELVAPMRMPYPCTAADARELIAEHSNPIEAAEVESVAGGGEQSIASVVETVCQGLDGVIKEFVVQLTPLDIDITRVQTPTRLVYGELDPICPPVFGQWLADRLPNAQMEIVPGASHSVAYPRWLELLS